MSNETIKASAGADADDSESREIKQNSNLEASGPASETETEPERDKGIRKDSDGPTLPQHQHQHGRSQRLLTSKTVFVTGLAPGLATIHIEKLFQKFGTVIRLDIKTSKTNSSSRFCFVEFDTLENAQKAMDNLNGRMLLHKRLVVQPAHDLDNSAAHARGGSLASSSMSPAKEERLLDKKIEELKRKINAAKKK